MRYRPVADNRVEIHREDLADFKKSHGIKWYQNVLIVMEFRHVHIDCAHGADAHAPWETARFLFKWYYITCDEFPEYKPINDVPSDFIRPVMGPLRPKKLFEDED